LQRKGALLGGKAFLAPLGVTVEPAGIVVQLAPIDLHNTCGKALGKRPVMADKNQCAGFAQQKIFQPGDGGDVQVVGGFVQNEVFRADQRPRQSHAPLGAAGERGKICIGIQPQMIDDGKHIAVALPAAAQLKAVLGPGMGCGKGRALLAQNLRHQRKNRAAPAFRHILRHLAYERAGADNHAGIGLHLPAEQRQQR
jgi:hypothetical protein